MSMVNWLLLLSYEMDLTMDVLLLLVRMNLYNVELIDRNNSNRMDMLALFVLMNIDNNPFVSVE